MDRPWRWNNAFRAWWNRGKRRWGRGCRRVLEIAHRIGLHEGLGDRWRSLASCKAAMFGLVGSKCWGKTFCIELSFRHSIPVLDHWSRQGLQPLRDISQSQWDGQWSLADWYLSYRSNLQSTPFSWDANLWISHKLQEHLNFLACQDPRCMLIYALYWGICPAQFKTWSFVKANQGAKSSSLPRLHQSIPHMTIQSCDSRIL